MAPKAAPVDDANLAICPICLKPTKHPKQSVGGDGVEIPSYSLPTFHADCAHAHPEKVYRRWHHDIRSKGGKAI